MEGTHNGGKRAPVPLPARGETRANGIRLVYRDWAGPAAPSYPPTVLLHGVLQSGEGMANLAAHLARAGRVVVPDLRGRGESGQPAAGYDPGTMADDVAALIELLRLERPVVIGRLHGGLVAYHLAARRPDLVRGLVMGDTAPEVDQARADRALAAIRALPPRFASLDEATRYYEETLQLPAARARHDIPHDLLPDAAGGYRWRHNLALIERIEAAAMPRADWDVLGRVRCPALVLRGQRGEVPPAVADRFCQLLPGCLVQTIFGARHDVFLGPGAEQAFGAIDLFLMRLQDEGEPAPRPTAGSSGGDIVERIVRATNARDDDAIAALFAPDGRLTIHRPDRTRSVDGPEAARAAFRELLTRRPGPR
jgi:pimeloyl-ACP methyl ester carboxylesterase